MKCDTAFDRYLALDKNQAVPLGVSLHLLRCPVCRTAVRTLTRAERVLAAPLSPLTAFAAPGDVKADFADQSVQLAFERIQAAGFAYAPIEAVAQRVSMSRWLFAGIVLAAGFGFVPFSMIGEWSSNAFGLAFSVPFYIVGGLAVTLYGGLFIGSNIDFFVKKFGFR